MSDTPRTDENTMTFEQSFKSLFIDFVDAGFAQQLERELAAAKAKSEERLTVLADNQYNQDGNCIGCLEPCECQPCCDWARAMGEGE